MVPGFAIEEFITYLEVLRTQKISIRLPTPFIFLPFLTYIVQTEKEAEYISSLGEGGSIEAYTEKEVDEAINSLEKEAIIKSIDPLFREEKRFSIADETLKGLIYSVWQVHQFDFRLLGRRWLYHNPTNEDRKYVESYTGERLGDIIISTAYDKRIKIKEEQKHNKNNRKLDIEEETTEEIKHHRSLLIEAIIKKYEKTTPKNEVIYEIIEGICPTPLALK